MNTNRFMRKVLITVIFFLLFSCVKEEKQHRKKFEPTWESVRTQQIPQWILDAKFGIYTHWGVYSVPAKGPNGTWYGHFMYQRGGDRGLMDYHEKTHGPLSEFGYKDFIPLWKAEKFNADEWADLFVKAGARFAGPVAEHHDGFALWPTKYNKYNSVEMGPKRDIVGELEKAIKKRGMKYVTTFHHATNWWYFPLWDDQFDAGTGEWADLYGPPHEKGAPPTKEYHDEWLGKIKEVIDAYDPDLIWFDNGLGALREDYRLNFLAYYYNKALERNKEVVVTYKWDDFPPGIALYDLELRKMKGLTKFPWLTDSTVDDWKGWGYITDGGWKTVNTLVDNLVDRVSKNGMLLLNVGPKADGTIPDEARELLLGIGAWLDVNGEAIYDTTPWVYASEGEETGDADQAIYERGSKKAVGTRFTTKGDAVYAIFLDWPGEEALIKTLVVNDFPNEHVLGIYEEEIMSVSMLGIEDALEWRIDEEGLKIKTPDRKPCEHAFVFKIQKTRL